MTNGRGKSDSSTVPANSLNKAEGPAAEVREGRELAKGNSLERNAPRTQGREGAPSALERVRQATTVHCALPPHLRRRTTADSVPDHEEGCGRGRRRGDVGALRRDP